MKRRTALWFALIACWLSSAASAQERPYLVIPETVSPDGQYASSGRCAKARRLSGKNSAPVSGRATRLPAFADPRE